MHEAVPHVAAADLGALVKLRAIRVHLKLELILLPNLLLVLRGLSLSLSLILMLLEGSDF